MTDDPFPHDFGAKIHPSHRVHQRLFARNPEHVPFVACKFRRSSWFVNQPRWAFLRPEQDLFITTFESDKNLLGRETSTVVDRLAELEDIAQGAFVGDRFTYPDLNRRELVKEIDEGVKRQLAVKDLLDERGIDMPLYPTILGWEDWHFERCRELIEELGASVAFDATQYNSGRRLANHVKTAEEVLDLDRTFVNGCTSLRRLRKLPKSVVACSGSWGIRKRTEDNSGNPQRENLPEVVEKRVDALNTWQSELTNYL